MINNTENFDSTQNASEGNMSLNEQGVSGAKSKFKEYGKKSLSPLVDLLHKYKGDIDPYMAAIGKGLQGAVDSLNNDQNATDADKAVSGWFSEASNWFNGAKDKLSSNKPSDLLDYLETQARNNPAMMFSTSYIAGLAFGRLGRHFTRIRAKGTTGTQFAEQGSFNDESSFAADSSFDGQSSSIETDDSSFNDSDKGLH